MPTAIAILSFSPEGRPPKEFNKSSIFQSSQSYLPLPLNIAFFAIVFQNSPFAIHHIHSQLVLSQLGPSTTAKRCLPMCSTAAPLPTDLLHTVLLSRRDNEDKD